MEDQGDFEVVGYIVGELELHVPICVGREATLQVCYYKESYIVQSQMRSQCTERSTLAYHTLCSLPFCFCDEYLKQFERAKIWLTVLVVSVRGQLTPWLWA